ncbi:MAG: hypothetical protein FJX74_14000 [Armatimonadetes bacterium]|nr:hypothetical protein [Armatimonadota bacterium]
MRRSYLGIDLFPFMAVLMCFLGALVTIALTVVALSVLFPAEVWQLGLPGSQHKTPYVVEWDGANVTVHPDRVSVAAPVALANGMQNDTAFGRALAQVKADPQRRFIFVIVRPTGFSTFLAFLKRLSDQGIDVGYEPALTGQEIAVVVQEAR